jgi:acyl carrier protein
MADIQLDDLRKLLVENCMLRVAPEEIQMDTTLFGPGSLGLDSIDALQLTVGIEKAYGVAIKDPASAREALQSVTSLRDWLAQQTKTAPPAAG